MSAIRRRVIAMSHVDSFAFAGSYDARDVHAETKVRWVTSSASLRSPSERRASVNTTGDQRR